MIPASKARLVLWAPRFLGVLVALFLGMFALDAFEEGQTFLKSLPDFLIHAAPAFLLLVVVAISWRRDWIGGVVFTVLALCYAATTLYRLDWILSISGPLLIVGLLYFWSWRHRTSR